MLRRVSRFGRFLVPKRVQEFFGRHFTWLSGALVGFSIAVNLILILVFIPGATTNALVGLIISVGAIAATLVSSIGGLIAIHEFFEKREVLNEYSTSTDSDDEGLSAPARGFVETDEQRLQRAMEELEGWFTIRGNGEIVLHPEPDQMGSDRKGMLYVFAARVSSDAEVRDSPVVSKQEIRDEIDFTRASAGVFIDKMYDEDEYFIDLHYDPEDTDTLYEMDDEEITFELNVGKVDEVVDYIRANRGSPD